jgi:D-glycero-D-manno-heptose 1,7-bisphosphate phosphatase
MGKRRRDAEADMTRRAVFLDRDGVLNRATVRNGKPYPPPDLDAFEILPGTADALRRLRRAGFALAVVTNQPDVGRGDQSKTTVEAMHAKLRAELPLDDIQTCWDETDARRYKPAPGMIYDAAAALNVSVADSFMVGDRWRDVDCGKAAGCFSVFIDRGYAEPLRAAPDAACADLPAAVDLILSLATSHCGSPRHD